MTLDWRRDGLVLLLLAVMLVMLGAALTGAYRAFGYALVAFVGLLTGLGCVRRGDPLTWAPPLVATVVLFAAFVGMFANETAVVRQRTDTVLGFQTGTAFLIYGVWIPAFFTMGLGFALIFDRLNAADDRDRQPTEGRR
jgi:hypothetical protein